MADTETAFAPPRPEKTFLDDKEVVVCSRPDPAAEVGQFFGVDEKALVRKLDLKLLPALTLLYLLSFLDRSNGE